MKFSLLSKWMTLVLFLLALNFTSINAQTTETFNYTGSMQTWVVPSGVNTVFIEAWGAQGGANWINNDNFGGYAAGDLAVTPGQTLYIYVGQQPNSITGGWNGGGNGEGAGQGGGGGSDVRINGTTLNDRVISAGAGGGAGYWASLHVVGGQGGGLTGGEGYRVPSYAANPGGLGGTQTAGGAYGTCVTFNVTALAGSFGQGGSPSACGCEGYGGGGGWYGGAGSGNCRGGGGGSSYIGGVANGVTNTGVRTGHGEIKITYGDGCIDADMDGITDCDGDCDDNNPNIYPGSPTNSPALTNYVTHNASSVTVYWSTIGGSTSYKLRYRIMGSNDQWIEATSLRAWRRLYNLNAGITYEIQFSNYHSGVWTCWSENYEFSTPAARPFNSNKKSNNSRTYEDDGTIRPMEINPNPSNDGKVTVEIQAIKNQNAAWNLSDLSGKIIRTGNFQIYSGENQNELNFDKLPAGVYFFKATLAEGVQAVKLIVE